MSEDDTTMSGEDDLSRLDAMSESALHQAALDDPDAQPMTHQQLASMQRVVRSKTIRRALGLTEEEFSARYQISLTTIRDWEAGRVQPDQTAKAYLKAIAGDPFGVGRSLTAGSRAA